MKTKNNRIVSFALAFVLMAGVFMSHALPAQAAESPTNQIVGSNQTVEVRFSDVDQTKYVNYTMPVEGYVYFIITPTHSTDTCGGVECKIKKGSKTYERDFAFYGEGGIKTSCYAIQKGEKLTVQVMSSYYLFDWVDVCSVRAIFVKCNNFESENNNTKKTADKAVLKRNYKGLLMWDEKDYWVFKPKKTKKYSFRFNNLWEDDKTTSYEAAIYTASGKLKEYTYVYPERGWKSMRVKLKKNKKYYIKISNDNNQYQVLYAMKIK